MYSDKWNTKNVETMEHMFYRTARCASYSLNLSKWNVSKVTVYNDFNTGVTSKVTPPVWVN